MTMINGYVFTDDRVNDKKIDHSQYYHKIMRETKEMKGTPWLWCVEIYHILESKESKYAVNNRWLSALDKDDWLIIKYFFDKEEAKKYVERLELSDHKPRYDIIDGKESADDIYRFLHWWSVRI